MSRRAPSRRALRAAVLASLQEQGFVVQDGVLVPARPAGKQGLRDLHAPAVAHAVAKARHNLVRHEPWLIERLAETHDVHPEAIAPRLVQVHRHSEEELLFRWARLHWSVPTSAGYGRRIRFLVIDGSNGKLIGLLGLGDPVFALGPRDAWVGWEAEQRRASLRHVLDAFVLGAVPPYSRLLAGKLVALLATSVEVRAAFAERYAARETVISGHRQDGRLALITTVSALGRSSMYNRLRYRPDPNGPGRLVFEPVGFTQGSGGFHFSHELYESLTAYALVHCVPTAKASAWGSGFRNRRELVGKALSHLGFSSDWLYHGVSRQVLCAPLAPDARPFLRGQTPELHPHTETAEELVSWWRARWLLPRAARLHEPFAFSPESWRLWPRSSPRSSPPRRSAR